MVDDHIARALDHPIQGGRDIDILPLIPIRCRKAQHRARGSLGPGRGANQQAGRTAILIRGAAGRNRQPCRSGDRLRQPHTVIATNPALGQRGQARTVNLQQGLRLIGNMGVQRRHIAAVEAGIGRGDTMGDHAGAGLRHPARDDFGGDIAANGKGVRAKPADDPRHHIRLGREDVEMVVPFHAIDL